MSLRDLRRTNLSQVVTALHRLGPLSRAALTRDLGLNRSTIGDLVTELVGAGLVRESSQPGDGRSGRPSLLVSPREDRCVVAVEVKPGRVTVAVVALGGAIVARREEPLDAATSEVNDVVDLVVRQIQTLRAQTPPHQLLGVAVALPGPVGGPRDRLRLAPNLGWVDAPFPELLSQRLGRPVAAGNDARLGALAERLRGAAVGYADLAYVAGGIGLGGGFIVGGQELQGHSGYAGEVGHLLVDSQGADCGCGGVGCWETKVGEDQLLVRGGRPAGGGPAAVAAMIAAAEAGDEQAREALDEAAHWTAVGLRSVLNVFNPEIVVLGGTLAKVWQARARMLDDALHNSALMSPRAEVTIRAAQLGDDSALVGAAELAFADLLADPIRVANNVPDSEPVDVLA